MSLLCVANSLRTITFRVPENSYAKLIYEIELYAFRTVACVCESKRS